MVGAVHERRGDRLVRRGDAPERVARAGAVLPRPGSSGGANGDPIATPDASGTIAMAAGAGKVIVANTTAGVGCNGSSAPCTAAQLAQIVDLVGYGAANFFEGAGPAPVISGTTADFRAENGCTDTDNNNLDFAASVPSPRNTATAPLPCGGVTVPGLSVADVSVLEGDSGTTTMVFDVSLSAAAGDGGVTFDIATSDGTAQDASSTGEDADYVAQSLSGQVIPAGSSGPYEFSVSVNGDADIEADETFLVDVTNVVGASIADGQATGTIEDDDASPCDSTFTPIYQIQGTGPNAAITGTVTTRGVVVGDFEGTAAASGFYLQDATGDGDPATSDGIFVFTGSADLVAIGDLVTVTGFARERFNQTTINGSNTNTAAVPAGDIALCGTGSVTPTDVELPFADASTPERYEGMAVRLPQPLVISEYFNYDRFGELVLALPLDGEPRPFTGTALEQPGAAANARSLANSLRRITLDDAQSAQNPVRLRHPNGDAFSLTNRFRGGDTVQDTVGVLGFDFSLYRIFPTGPAKYTAANPRPATPEPVGGHLKVAAMNTLNFFVTLDALDDDTTDVPGDNVCGGNANLDCRGADLSQPQEFDRQRDKLLTALSGLDGDVIGLNELENTPGVEPLESITSGMPGYDFVDTGTIGTDAIKVGLIYRPAVVTPVGAFQTLDSRDDARFIDTKSRPSLAQTFEVNATGARFTVVVNHLKSKGSACTDVGDPDAGDGQDNCSGTRTLAAQALVDWIATDPTGSGDPDFLIMGDLNSYAMEDPISAIRAGADDVAGTSDDYTNLIAKFGGPYAYSYTFDGEAGYLDHTLANSTIASQVTGAADWHINSDEPDVLDYDTSFKPAAQEALYEKNQYRTSDHDAVVVGLDLTHAAPVGNGDSYRTNEDTTLDVSAPGVLSNDSDAEGNPLTASVVRGPAHGTLTLRADGSFRYVPAANFFGADSFTYAASDGFLSSDDVTVSIEVSAVNDAPTTLPDALTVAKNDGATTIDVLANDTDVDGDALTVIAFTQGGHGRVQAQLGGLRYTPDRGFRGTDTFRYTVSDGHGGTATEVVRIVVTKK